MGMGNRPNKKINGQRHKDFETHRNAARDWLHPPPVQETLPILSSSPGEAAVVVTSMNPTDISALNTDTPHLTVPRLVQPLPES